MWQKPPLLEGPRPDIPAGSVGGWDKLMQQKLSVFPRSVFYRIKIAGAFLALTFPLVLLHGTSCGRPTADLRKGL